MGYGVTCIVASLRKFSFSWLPWRRSLSRWARLHARLLRARGPLSPRLRLLPFKHLHIGP